MDIEHILIAEKTQDIEKKYDVEEIQEVEKGWQCWFKRGGKLNQVFVPHGYEMTRTKHPGIIKGGLLNRYNFTIAKRRESSVAVCMYGNSAPYQIDEIAEISRNGLYAKGMQDLRKGGKLPGWIIAVALVGVVLVGGLFAMNSCSSKTSDKENEPLTDLNNNGIWDQYEVNYGLEGLE